LARHTSKMDSKQSVWEHQIASTERCECTVNRVQGLGRPLEVYDHGQARLCMQGRVDRTALRSHGKDWSELIRWSLWRIVEHDYYQDLNYVFP
jgi:hypothetical protein